MGNAPNLPIPFMPKSQEHHHSIMTKVWTFSTSEEAQQQQKLLESIQSDQHNHYCKIVCNHLQRVNEGKCWKVVSAFEYGHRSLRQEIIERKNKNRYSRYFTQKQLSSILNLTGLFLNNYHQHFCNHTDLFASIFIDQKDFKICRPELLPCRCSNRFCNNAELRQKVADSVLELMLLEKVVRGGPKEKQRAQYLYSHSPWLVQLLQKIVTFKTDLLNLSRESKYVQYQNKLINNTTDSAFSEEKTVPKQTTIPAAESGQNLFQTKSMERTKPLSTNRRGRSLSYQFQYDKKAPPSIFRPEKATLLDTHCHRELAISIGGDQEDSTSLNNPNMYDNILLSDFDPIASSKDQLQNNSLIVLEPVSLQENQSARINRSYSPILPATIMEEQNQTYSQESRKSGQLSHSSSQQVSVIQEDGCRYLGQLRGGKKQGKGRLVYPNGVYYEGEWANNQMHGLGSLYYANGNPFFSGQWKEGKFHGRGTFFNQHEESISGSFNYRDFSEIGQKWRSFEGQFVEDKKNGSGLLTLSNGETLQGFWRDDVVQGRCTFRTIEGLQINGFWIDNVLYLEDTSTR